MRKHISQEGRGEKKCERRQSHFWGERKNGG
jgi:hypothetical protein